MFNQLEIISTLDKFIKSAGPKLTQEELATLEEIRTHLASARTAHEILEWLRTLAEFMTLFHHFF